MMARIYHPLPRACTAAALVLTQLFPIAAAAGRPPLNQFGIQTRADAASEMIVIAVQQAVSSLPPSSGQAFTYEYDPATDAFTQSAQLGPTILRSTNSIGADRLSVRFATTYFNLDDTFNPIVYHATGTNFPHGAYAKFGTTANAQGVLFGFAATYGFTDRIEATVNIPFSVVDAQASQIYTAVPPPSPPYVAGARSVELLNQQIHDGTIILRTASFTALGADFNEGTHVGLGRISVGGKGLLLADRRGELAVSGDFYCNSPNQAQFAGSDSASILPRVIGQFHAAKRLNLLADVGYEYDFQVNELSRFVWNAGVSIPVVNATFDFGVGGSLFDEAVHWTPVRATGVDNAGGKLTLTALDPDATELGTNFVDLLFGMKVQLIGSSVLSGSVTVPITGDGFRPVAVGTLAMEYYF